MTLTQIGLLFIFASNIWALWVLKRAWYGKKNDMVEYYHDDEGNLQFNYKEDE